MKVFCNVGDLVKRLELHDGMKIIDVGCGAGRIAIPVAKVIGPQGIVTCLDMQAAMLKKCQTRAQRFGLQNIEPRQTDVALGKLGTENSFDRALLVTVLGEVPDRKNLLKEIHQALKPGGILSVTEVLPDPCYQGLNFVKELSEEVGFRVDYIYNGVLSYTINLQKNS